MVKVINKHGTLHPTTGVWAADDGIWDLGYTLPPGKCSLAPPRLLSYPDPKRNLKILTSSTPFHGIGNEEDDISEKRCPLFKWLDLSDTGFENKFQQ